MLENYFKNILQDIGEDITREGLIDTPKRAAQALKFLTKGYHQDLNRIVNNALFETDCSDMVIVKNIELYSLCEHHLLPFIGQCHIGYIPRGKVIGLSKAARIVDHYARRLQIQEQLTHQIATTLQDIIQPEGVAVVIEAKHLCMMMRGVQKQNSVMTTSAMLGAFHDELGTRTEFLQLIKG
ncbi:MAG: GTP cyclohydrolase 1 [Legionellaceae bacterium]